MKKRRNLMLINFLIILFLPIVISQCTDTDGGQDFFEQGNMIDSDLGYNYMDYCTDSDRLVEFYCDPGYHFVYKLCSDEGKVCSEGSCIEGTPEPPPNSQPSPDFCNDTDGGQKFNERGTVIDETGRTETDYCTTSSKLVEWFCRSDNYISYEYQFCNCKDGVCISEERCADSDTSTEYPDGKNPYLKGITTSGGNTWTDFCVNTSHVQEGYCDFSSLTNIKSKIFSCSNTCNSGACVYTPPKCNEDSILGDINDDKSVTYEDYLKVYSMATSSISLPENICCVDLNKDNKVTSEDAQLVYDTYSGKINLGGCGWEGCVIKNACTTAENCLGVFNKNCGCDDIPNDNCPMITDDTSGPVISEMTLSPSAGSSGTIFSIVAKVEDESALQYAKTYIYILNDNQNSVALDLFDDGQHNDDAAKDGMYGATWNSESYEDGTYSFYVTTKDIYNNDGSSPKNYFLIGDITDICKEVISGHNEIDENRANIVFVGVNYPDKEFFKEIVKETVDYSGNNQGILFLEPFKSNKNKFNFWYVDETKDLGQTHWDDTEASRKERIRLSLMCPFNNKYVISYTNTFFRPQALYKEFADISFLDIDCSFRQYCDNIDLDNDGSISRQDYSDYLSITWGNNFQNKSVPDANEDGNINGDDLEISYLCQYYRIGSEYEYSGCLRKDYFDDYKTYTSHEFGHLFGHLLDEYLESGVNPIGEPYSGNCFEGTKSECLSGSNSLWYDLLGYGCGDNNKIDCVLNDECIENLDNSPECYKEVGCFEGCNYQLTGWFRGTLSSIMKNNFVSEDYFTYGPVNERILCEELKSITGSVEGICTTRYNIS